MKSSAGPLFVITILQAEYSVAWIPIILSRSSECEPVSTRQRLAVEDSDAMQEFLTTLNGGHFTAPSPAKANTATDPLNGYTLSQLEEYVEERASRGRPGDDGSALRGGASGKASLLAESLADEDDSGSLFLSADEYIQSIDRLNPDGSIGNQQAESIAAANVVDQNYANALENFAQTAPLAPYGSVIDVFNDQTVDDLWSMIQQQGGQPDFNQQLSEALHEKVFCNETGFLQNSAAFLEALTNSDAAAAAAVERRGRRFRERQEQAISALEEQIRDFDELRKNQNAETTRSQQQARQFCSKCKCIMTKEEAAASHELCGICYKDVLVATSKKAEETERQDLLKQRRARRTMQSFREPLARRRSAMAKRAVPASRGSKSATSAPPITDIARETTNNSMRQPLRPKSNENSGARRCNDAFPRPPRVVTPPSPWVEVTDPDTKEVFYWNEETEEMRWEL